ncbi:hypothetical protein C7387_1039 [Yokenella regensburgei]|uniref:Uncharacterized protein n=1 Tax=Yokenella regensburgei TaxID=158877 RepID=A0ABX9S0J9_9ENTR|nr:hypothetical protein C7387_1039 [Yokenella regensburgei]
MFRIYWRAKCFYRLLSHLDKNVLSIYKPMNNNECQSTSNPIGSHMCQILVLYIITVWVIDFSIK